MQGQSPLISPCGGDNSFAQLHDRVASEQERFFPLAHGSGIIETVLPFLLFLASFSLSGSLPSLAPCPDRPAAEEVQLDLISDYRSNVALDPTFQQYFRTHRPPLLAIWRKNDPHFLPPGAEAYRRDIPDAEVRFLDTGHFTLETHPAEIGAAMRDFLGRVVTN